MRKFVMMLGSGVMALAFFGILSALIAMQWYRAAGPLSDTQTLLIKPGSSFKTIVAELNEAGVIEYPLTFSILTTLRGENRRFKAGEYEFDPGISPAAVAHMLVSGQSVAHAVTIPEGKTSREITQLLMADDRLSGEISTPIAEGSLLPNTHLIHRGDARDELIARMQQDQQALLATLWEKRADNLPINTPQEAVILASIVEKETGVDGERGKVASVFVNRLRKGMKLQSDPTTVYAIEMEKGPMTRPLYRKDWEFAHPYNTYHAEGLPPGPICHPGEAALRAVLNPPETDALYFVATGRGGHFFARTLAEHNRNIQRYKQARREQQP